jgi:hypothetical protein
LGSAFEQAISLAALATELTSDVGIARHDLVRGWWVRIRDWDSEERIVTLRSILSRR